MQTETSTNTDSVLPGAQRAAQLLMVLGEDNAAVILRQLNQAEVEKLGEVMTELSQVSNRDVGSVLQHFVEQCETDNSIRLQADDYTRNVMVQALGQEKAMDILSRISRGADTGALKELSQLEATLIAGIIRDEHPQIQATVISYLDPEKARDVLAVIPEEQFVEIVVRMASMESVDPKALTELNQSLQLQVAGVVSKQSSATEGVKTVANILNTMNRELGGTVMEKLTEADPELAQRIQDQLYVFEDLKKIPDRDFQVVLREVATDKLSLAMKGAEEDLKEKVFKNMSSRAADIFREDIENLGPVKVSDVEEAQKEILETVKRLGDNGEITLSSGSADMVA